MLDPCNSPRRPEWSIFSSLLEREAAPGPQETAAAASARMKLLLVEACGKNPKGLITACMHRTGEKHTSWLMHLFDEMGQNPAAIQDFYETVASRLLMPESGRDAKITATNQAKGRGSSMRMLEYWDPAARGMVPYVRWRIKNVLAGVRAEKKEANRLMVSVGHLEEFDQVMAARPPAPADEKETDLDGIGLNPDFAPTARFYDDSAAPTHLDDSPEGRRLHAAGVAVLGELLDSIEDNNTNLRHPPLHQPAHQDTLADLGVDLTLWRQSLPSVALWGGRETPGGAARRIALEENAVIDLMTALGGPTAVPSELAERLQDYRLSEELDDLATPALDSGATPEEPACAPLPSDEDPASVVLARAHLTPTAHGLRSPQRPEFALFGLVLGRRFTPAESPESRRKQLTSLALRVVREKCQGLDTPEDLALGATLEAAVTEWDPATRGFGQMFPDVLDHLEQQMTPRADKNQSKVGPLLLSLEFSAETFPGVAAPRSPASPPHSPRARNRRPKDTIETLLAAPDFVAEVYPRTPLEESFWSAACRDPAALGDAKRPDYQFLCSKLGIEPVTNLSGADLSDQDLQEEVKHLALTWTAHLTQVVANSGSSLAPQFNAGLVAAAEDYDPGKDGFFAEALNSYFADQLATDHEKRHPSPRVSLPSKAPAPVLAPPDEAEDLQALRSLLQPPAEPEPSSVTQSRVTVERQFTFDLGAN